MMDAVETHETDAAPPSAEDPFADWNRTPEMRHKVCVVWFDCVKKKHPALLGSALACTERRGAQKVEECVHELVPKNACTE